MRQVHHSEILSLARLDGMTTWDHEPPNGSISRMEALMLSCMVDHVRPSIIFEFGTFLGHTARLLSANQARWQPSGMVFTLDLPANHDTTGDAWVDVDEGFAKAALADPPDFSGERIMALRQDSLHFEPGWLTDRVQFVFIDGNHHPDYLHKDTCNAFVMLDINSPGCIFWHDYGRPGMEQLTAYLDDLGQQLPLEQIVGFDDCTLVLLRQEGARA